jgi:hypothetical protein
MFLSIVKRAQQLNLKKVNIGDAQSVQYQAYRVLPVISDRPWAVADTRDACGQKRKGDHLFHISYLQMHRFIIIIGSF